MSLLTLLSSAFKPATELIDSLHTSDEERLQLKQSFLQTQAALTTRVLEIESRLVEAKAKIITAEANGQSWLQRNWRPITMLTFLVLVVADTFGLTAHRLAPDAWTLLQIGLGGYVVGRSAEKIAPTLVEAFKKQ